ncbi:hypothetical protein Ac2012v2_002445, partial [Leucoagaricus gongylophorus]
MSSSCSNLASAGYSGYEYLSRLKALGQPQEALPKDIAIETLFGAILGIIGAALLGPPLKQISWASEMRQHKIDEMDARDIVAYAIAFIAAYLQDSGEHTVKFTFAFHRAELVSKDSSPPKSSSETKNPFHPCSIGAFFNGVFLLALALSVFLQSMERFVHIERIEEPFFVLVIGCVGLTLNIISALVIHDHHGHGGHSHGSQTPSIMPEQNTDSLRHHIHATHNHTIDPPVATHQHNLGLVGVLVHLIGYTSKSKSVLCRPCCVACDQLDNFRKCYPYEFLMTFPCTIFTSGICRN